LLEHVDVPPVKSLFDVPFRKILAQTTTNIHMVVLYDKVFAPHSEFTLEQSNHKQKKQRKKKKKD